MRVIETIAELRTAVDAARCGGNLIGLVPTMGYLHDGHLSLVRRARQECDFVIVTIFVNPLQFGPGEDLDRYPRDPEGDAAKLRDLRADVLFTPSQDEMYPEGRPRTSVHVNAIGDDLCGAGRPGHFDGVALVVAKLLAAAEADSAYFGRKDAQQLAIVTSMAADLSVRTQIVPCPTVRELDGLAMSSRNAYLTPDERAVAPVIFRALEVGAKFALEGQRDPKVLTGKVQSVLAQEPRLDVEYIEVRDARTIQRLERLHGEVLLAVAVRLGAARLIDNIVLYVDGPSVAVEAGEIKKGATS